MNEIILHRDENRTLVIRQDQLSDLHIIQQQDSSCRIVVVCLSEKAPTNAQWSATIHVDQQGTGCHTELYGLAFLRGSQRLNLTTRLHHAVGQGYSNQLFKYILSDTARGSFTGELVIAPNAQQVEAHQTNRNILLSSTAMMQTQPQLEIYADDVQASHGASTGQLDESALFYMLQRGISPESAKRLLLRAFVQDVLDTIPDDTQRAELENAVDRIIQ